MDSHIILFIHKRKIYDCVWHSLKKPIFFLLFNLFLLLFIGQTILFQLVFNFIYSIFCKKFSILIKYTIPKRTLHLQNILRISSIIALTCEWIILNYQLFNC